MNQRRIKLFVSQKLQRPPSKHYEKRTIGGGGQLTVPLLRITIFPTVICFDLTYPKDANIVVKGGALHHHVSTGIAIIDAPGLL